MFAKFLTQNQFLEKYMTLFCTRFTIGNMDMENLDDDITIPEKATDIFGNIMAFSNLIKENPQKISPYDLIEIANTINNGIFTKGFRKTQVIVKSAKNFSPPLARDVPEAIYSLFNTYHNIWKDLDTYEREARFHIELVRIQPFEDGNKRTARTLTNYNLLKNNKAPVIITKSQIEEYFRCIDEYDVYNLAKLFKENSEKELEVMINLYKMVCNGTFCNNENETPKTKIYEQKKT